jgi:hypothetical protein
VSERDQTLGETARRVYSKVLSGDLSDVRDTLARLAVEESAMAGAWAAAITAAAWMVRPDLHRAPERRELERFLGAQPDARLVAALSLSHLERASAVAFDPGALEAWLALHERLLAGTSHEQTEAGLWLEAARAWAALLRGRLAGLFESTSDLEKRALTAKVAPLVIDASVQRALLASLSGDLETGTALARRASRMARTEGLPQQEYLAHLTLARARRLSRHPHLAIRILTALEPMISTHFTGWLAWELLMAGEVVESTALLARSEHTSLALAAARALSEVVRSAVAGDRAVFERSARELTRHTRGFSLVEREAVALLTAADYRAADVPDAEPVRAWCAGREAPPPPALHGLCMRPGTEAQSEAEDVSEAYVLARVDAPPRRILGLGSNLVDLPEIVRLRRTRRRQGRVEIMTAIIAASPAGIEQTQAFEQAYELPYEAEVHRGVFEVLLHRVRAYIEAAGELEREEGVLRIRLRRPLLVPDPRCARPLHDRLLRILAREGRATASDAASKVGLSLRAVQDALKALIEDGICSSERDGRQIVYVVEDTTFSEPTQRLAVARK